jgi:hypothetical protein
MLLGMVLDSAFADLTMLAEEMVRTVRTYSMNISSNIVRVVFHNIIICVVLSCAVLCSVVLCCVVLCSVV